MLELCPCGSGNNYQKCCGKYVNGGVLPETPEQLMRSRYTAYTQANIEYIKKTMRGPAAVGFDPDEARQWAERADWLGLEVVSSAADGDVGEVMFVARYQLDGQSQEVREHSIFERYGGHWYYTNQKRQKTGRNDPCPCNSGRKYKKCCG